jgi:hypothetical protein
MYQSKIVREGEMVFKQKWVERQLCVYLLGI